jgi:hypothetical protein
MVSFMYSFLDQTRILNLDIGMCYGLFTFGVGMSKLDSLLVVMCIILVAVSLKYTHYIDPKHAN